jgi:hypothetical protein
MVMTFSSCARVAESAPEKTEAPAKVSGPVVKESELASVRLSPEAETRLGIEITPVITGAGNEVRRFVSDVTLPPGRSVTVTAPAAGTLKASPAPPPPGALLKKDQPLFEITPLLPLPRDLRVTAEADVEQARTRVETAKLR